MRSTLLAVSTVIFFHGFALTARAAEAEKSPEGARPAYRISYATSPIQVDGALEEEAWREALRVEINLEVRPGENVPAPVSAECRLTYDQRALYVGCSCLDPEPGKIRAHLTDRDTIWRNDYVGIILDTFRDQRRAYQFFVNPLGVQSDVLRNEVGSGHEEDPSWDAIWESAGRITAEGYQVEMAIPFRAIRFPNGSTSHSWGFALYRAWPRTVRHEILSVPLDRNNSCLLCQGAVLEGLEGIAPGRDMEIIPTVTSQRLDTRSDTGGSAGLAEGPVETEGGLSARWGVTPNLSLNAALNPDFSQVEADAAQLDVNTRFALFYPEKRPFFMEGSDFFDTPIHAVYTRAVADPAWGLRATGKHGGQAFSAFVAKDRLLNLLHPSKDGSSYRSYDLANNVGALRWRRDVGAASTVGVLATSRQGEGYHNRVVGADGLLRLSPHDRVSFQLLRSSTRYGPGFAHQGAASPRQLNGTAFNLDYHRDTRNWAVWAWYRDLAPEFRADLGFVSRVDTRGGEVGAQRIFWGRPGQFLTRASLGAEVQRMEDHTGALSDQSVDLFVRLEGPYQSSFHLRTVSFQEAFEQTTYRGTRGHFYFNIRPSGDFTTSLMGRFGDAIDFANGRPARTARLSPGFTLNVGRHLYLEGNHQWERLQVAEGRLYRANLTQVRLIYQFSANLFARLVGQYLDLQRDPRLYRREMEAHTSRFFTQFLVSYKLNPQTVAFFGYADNREGEGGVEDLARTNRTLFLKLGYAWLL